jgi:Sulfotransferase family
MTVPLEPVPIFPFFIGAPRSGTTLIRAIFNAHSDMAIPDETNFIPILGALRGRYERPDGFVTSAFINDLFRQRSFRRWEMTRDYVRSVFDARTPHDYADAVRILFALFARRNGKSRYGDKTPRYIRDIPLLAELFPEARFIHIIRDGRDVALSILDVDFGPRTVASAALSWKALVTEGRGAGVKLGSRYSEVRYEDILSDPEKIIASMCELIDLPFDPAMLRYFEHSEEITAPAAWSRRHVRMPPTKGLRDWRSQMSHKEVATFEALAGDLLETLGYERVQPVTSMGAAMRAHARVLARDIRQLARRVRIPLNKRGGEGAVPVAPLLSSRPSGRQEIVSFLLAQEATTQADVKAFRVEFLQGRLLRLQDVTAWVRQHAKEAAAETHCGILEYLGREAWPLREPIAEGGVLDRLRLLGSDLAQRYGWHPAQATTFVLSGLSPIVSRIRSTAVGSVPFSSTLRIVLEVDPIVTPRDLAAHYRRARARETQGRRADATDKQYALALFVAEHAGLDWVELTRIWNGDFPDSAYKDAEAFQREAVSARRKLLDPY